MNHIIRILHKNKLNDILSDELNISIREFVNKRYANTKISDKAKKDLIQNIYLNAIVYWNLQANKEAKTIGANPTMELAKTRLNNLRKRSDATDLIICAVADYIAKQFEHSMNLGHSNAFIYLNSEATILTPPSLKLINPAPCYSFQYTGYINRFYSQCISMKVIDSTTSLDSFKMAFEGCDYGGKEPLKWTTTQKNHIVYLFDLLLEKKLIHKHIEKDEEFVQINPDVSIGALMGKTNNQVSKIRASWKQYGGTPSKADYIENLVASLTK